MTKMTTENLPVPHVSGSADSPTAIFLSRSCAACRERSAGSGAPGVERREWSAGSGAPGVERREWSAGSGAPGVE
jgi:hypothetical protein